MIKEAESKGTLVRRQKQVEYHDYRLKASEKVIFLVPDNGSGWERAFKG